MSLAPTIVQRSYAVCRRVAREAGSSFYPCFFLLPRPKRQAMEALYAFLRHTDDLGDSPRPDGSRREALLKWRATMERALHDDLPPDDALAARPRAHAPGQPRSDGAILPALAHAVQAFHIPEKHLHEVIDGVEMDLDVHRYETFDDLAVYCRRVASAVGLACIHVWGFRGEGALEPATACGIAFQLTNILRDLKEDAGRGRVYLPLEDLRQCSYSAEDLLAGVADRRFERLMDLEMDRAHVHYRQGAELFGFLDRRGQRVFGMMVATYHRLLERIAREPRAVLARRVRLSRPEKGRIALRWALLPPQRAALP